MKSKEEGSSPERICSSQSLRRRLSSRWILALIAAIVLTVVFNGGSNYWIGEYQPAKHGQPQQLCSALSSSAQHVEKELCDILQSQYDFTMKTSPVFSALEDVHYALETMQTNYFVLGVGTWPTSIDWTAAIFSTLMSASLGSLTRFLEYLLPPPGDNPLDRTMTYKGIQVENEINRYFSQSIAYYFGENAWDIRFEAYDDMLWVVLGWLENIRFIRLHASFHFPEVSKEEGVWYGEQFIPGFAHRARIFYDLTKQGWDTKLCGGGMIWNPRLTPYKNAITNQLFISASINMYLHFPGDNDTSPFLAQGKPPSPFPELVRPVHYPAHDPSYLQNAVDAYDWLRQSNMTNARGLYIDGFHIHNYGTNHTIGTGKCDERNEMVYTYNQGVILSGLRGLWESTNRRMYLEDGHQLIRNVIKATGWSVPGSDFDGNPRDWAGLGRNGILEELCDMPGRCSQDSQTFKGIFFHHFTIFCAPLPMAPAIPGISFGADKDTASLHAQSCREYAAWVAHNAIAAMGTRDDQGKFGMWWGAGKRRGHTDHEEQLPTGAVDYRNMPVCSSVKEGYMQGSSLDDSDSSSVYQDYERMMQEVDSVMSSYGRISNTTVVDATVNLEAGWDFNDRGRGRTVETQSGGLAVVRAMWEIVQMFRRPERD